MTDISALTRGLRTGIDTDPAQGAIVPPLYLSSNFSFAEFGEKRDYDYTRSGNPTRDLLAEALTTLEGGHAGTITATGMAAITLCVSTLLRPGDTILIPHDCYGGTWRLFDSLAGRGQFDYQCVDYSDASALEQALTGSEAPRVVWLETPSNPLLRITDIAAVTEAAHAVGALVVADNTFLSPVLQRPFELGVDAVVHSTTKFINGHSDVVGGAVIARTAELHDELAYWANVLGISGSPFDAYLTLRGLRTIHARLRTHQENAEVLVETLVDHPAVEAVHYPGLSTHPGHEIAARQQDGFGAMLSVELRGGEEAVRAFLSGLRCFSLAESLGGTESLIAHPSTMTHASMTAAARETAGIRDGLLRLSVGLERADDLRADLLGALDRASQVSVAGRRHVA
ncbi:cystathionine gamma-synthase [Ornithinimicrobium cavernae]|uniref:cystathionine gamma-synthase n=1 Tax=Ornithinimicrobium cavernae TaxID=2666047 RepID=UPI000D69D7E7|nr:cystathionine gamma-synthase [Ornithinimicrobium cavernae]